MPDTTKYSNYYEITELQVKIMKVIENWVHTQRTPIPKRQIIESMKEQGVKDFTTINAITSLLLKGYIRRAIGTSNKTYYVQLRSV